MAIRIGTNVASIAVQRHLSNAEAGASHALRAIASGSRIVNSGDDAAGFAISESLRGQATSLKQAKQNSDNAIGLVQVAEGGLNEQGNILIRLRELAVQSSSDTVGDDERAFLEAEFRQLSQEFDRIATTTTFGKKQLLTGSNEEFQFHLGSGMNDSDVIRYKLETDTRASAIGIDDLSVNDRSDARDALEVIDGGILQIATARSGFGAIQSRLEIAGNNLDLQRENVLAARSRISDADIAYEVSELVQSQVLQDLGTAALAQANIIPQRALKLLA